jgi:multidrug efflux pump subunit AcrB
VEEVREKSGLLGWFASNHVAANLLMFLIIAAGLLTIFTIKVEFFPEMSLDMITVTVPYLGASPSDTEEGVVMRVEEAIAAVDGIKRMTSSATEGAGMVFVEVEEYADVQEVLDDIKAEVDRIITFPEETEKPIIAEVTNRYEVITIVLYGDVSEKALKSLADEVRDDLTALQNISQVDVAGVRPYEISIEVSEKTLRRYGLTFDQVANAVRQSSLDVPAGSVKTKGGEILVRTEGQRYYGPEFEKIIVLTRNDGTEIRLGDIADVKDDFEDVDLYARFDGKKAAQVKVFRVGDQGALDVADTVKKYVEEKRNALPAGVAMATWRDTSDVLRARMDLLTRNAYLGLTLVFVCLTLFLNIRLAFWTTMGIPISFLGAFWLLPKFDVSLNMISLFAFIMSLGLVVDDAIVIGENIFAYRQRGMSRLEAAIQGAKEMAAPVVLAVLTTIFAFVPMLFIAGIMGKIMRVIPVVVISVLAVSLVEALLILPAHLSAGGFRGRFILFRLAERLRLAVERRMMAFVHGTFATFVMRAVQWRYVTLAIGVAVFAIIIGWVTGGYIKVVFFDAVEADNLVATVTMPQGVPLSQTQEVVARLEQAAEQVRAEFDERRPAKPSLFKHMATTIGDQPGSRGGGPVRGIGVGGGTHLAEVNIELISSEERDSKTESATKMESRWRELIGEIPGVSSLTFMSRIVSTGEAVNVELSHQNFDTLLTVVEQLKSILRGYNGVTDIADSFEEGKAELKLELKDTGRALGLTLADLARQVRQGFYGEEAQRIQRGRDDIRVMVRYPEQQRRSLADVENMRIRLPGGTEIPFKTVANVNYGRGYATIRRADRRRVVSVTADVDETVANTREINVDLAKNVLPGLIRRYPGLQYRFAGEERERNESLGSLLVTFPLALLAIYGLLAVQFRSYIQPLIVMSAIPFGIVGAVIGHILMGFVFMTKFNLSILSMFGIVALSGVVVNDSLILIDLINRERRSGIELNQIVRDCATRRFRPIMLTTLTTFFGLVPMMLERSLQARFLIPMAISLAFGVMFATLITLFLVPSLYMILEDIKSRIFTVSGE